MTTPEQEGAPDSGGFRQIVQLMRSEEFEFELLKFESEVSFAKNKGYKAAELLPGFEKSFFSSTGLARQSLAKVGGKFVPEGTFNPNEDDFVQVADGFMTVEELVSVPHAANSSLSVAIRFSRQQAAGNNLPRYYYAYPKDIESMILIDLPVLVRERAEYYKNGFLSPEFLQLEPGFQVEVIEDACRKLGDIVPPGNYSVKSGCHFKVLTDGSLGVKHPEGSVEGEFLRFTFRFLTDENTPTDLVPVPFMALRDRQAPDGLTYLIPTGSIVDIKTSRY